MPRTQVAADFEEGVAGATVVAADADLHDLGLSIAGGSVVTYTSESHTGALAARLAPGAVELSAIAVAESTRGGGGWFKIKSKATLPASATEQLFRIETTRDGGFSNGIYAWRSGSNYTIYSQNGDVPIATVTLPLDQWLYVSLEPSGQWAVGTEGSVIASGIEPTFDAATRTWTFISFAAIDDGVLLVDDIWVSYGPPITRLYPRDDGRGMSSAPRIWPQPKGRSRIIGGYQ